MKTFGKLAGSLLAGLGTAYIIRIVVEKTSKPIEPVRIKVAKKKPPIKTDDVQKVA